MDPTLLIIGAFKSNLGSISLVNHCSSPYVQRLRASSLTDRSNAPPADSLTGGGGCSTWYLGTGCIPNMRDREAAGCAPLGMSRIRIAEGQCNTWNERAYGTKQSCASLCTVEKGIWPKRLGRSNSRILSAIIASTSSSDRRCAW